MGKEQQIAEIIKILEENKPAKVFKKVSDDLDSGIRFVLMFLSDNKNVYASTISERINISRARVGILLKKMESKNLIEKIGDAQDGRIQVIKITEKGRQQCSQIKAKIREYISKTIDAVGYERLLSFLEIVGEIKNVLKGGGYFD